MEGVSFWSILKSRKFWVMVLAIVTAASLFATQQIDGWQFLEAVIASVAAYSTGVALEDAGQKMGAARADLTGSKVGAARADLTGSNTNLSGPEVGAARADLTGSNTNLSGPETQG